MKLVMPMIGMIGMKAKNSGWLLPWFWLDETTGDLTFSIFWGLLSLNLFYPFLSFGACHRIAPNLFKSESREQHRPSYRVFQATRRSRALLQSWWCGGARLSRPIGTSQGPRFFFWAFIGQIWMRKVRRWSFSCANLPPNFDPFWEDICGKLAS